MAHTNLDSELGLWYGCAGPLVQIPEVNSEVYYFVQGHMEHASQDTACIKTAISPPPRILCRVEGVTYLADPATDQVFTKIKLAPLTSSGPIQPPNDPLEEANPAAAPEFMKIAVSVVQGCFRVTLQSCASTLDPSVSHRFICKDVHGVVWTLIIRHSRAGHPFLSDGWTEFLNAKRVMAGDNILLMRDTRGLLRIGILRGRRNGGCGHGLDFTSVFTAATLATVGLSFEVFYYPRAATPDFVIKAARVEAAMQIPWEVGMKFKMPLESPYISPPCMYPGTISSIQDADPQQWPSSPWKCLQVTLDIPLLGLSVRRVSPWRVKLEPPMAMGTQQQLTVHNFTLNNQPILRDQHS